MTEQILIDIRNDKRPQFTDWAFLIWAYYSYFEPYDIYYNFAVDNVIRVPFPPTLQTNGLPLTLSTISSVSIDKMENLRAEYVEMKIEIGGKLIDEGLVIPHRKIKNGAVVIDFEQTVDDKELVKAYERCLEESYEKHTGKKVKILDEIKSKNKHIKIQDIKNDYPELYQKLVEKGIVKKDKIDRE